MRAHLRRSEGGGVGRARLDHHHISALSLSLSLSHQPAAKDGGAAQEVVHAA
jgi:hypothetical protein